ncbi:DUF2690 domain-containing protein [Streptomyces sp. MBT65]|uniref:helix-turn-helix domain-containing protein n=1 Tax=Streptomyces sp. MBT65 TaxID=1488395 RepID=UPI00190B1302|nr:XRE family transcriptional regulator [Streptomyces sp. MBT65]MBK3577375.1 DUF2690 domain-containing protein [Streptomyces sp. MBT65]
MNQLVASLRELKTRTGLSLAGLAAKTPYSKSSWERYLNGKTLPPREAVEELCRLAGEPVGRCVALWEIAEAETSGRGASEGVTAPPPPLPPAPVPEVAASPGHRRGVAALAVLGSVCALAGGLVVALLLLPHHHPSPAASFPSSTGSVSGPRCREATCEGRSPVTMHCGAQPDTLRTYRTATGAYVQLRHSGECGTSWTRMWGGRIGDRIEMDVSGRTSPVRGARVRTSKEANTYIYTVMTVTRPGTVIHSCFRPATGGGQECFEGRVH